MDNLLQELPQGPEEIVQLILANDSVKIERIVSNGQPSPADFWYDQAQQEWVLLVQGAATLEFKEGEKKQMAVGDYLLIPAHQKHRVEAVSNDAVWLAIYMRPRQ